MNQKSKMLCDLNAFEMQIWDNVYWKFVSLHKLHGQMPDEGNAIEFANSWINELRNDGVAKSQESRAQMMKDLVTKIKEAA